MNSITYKEILFVLLPLGLLLLLTLFLRKRFVTLAFIIITILTILFFPIRSFWITHNLETKKEILLEYLQKKYPKETFTIVTDRQTNHQNNQYILKATFSSEPNCQYNYLIKNNNKIKQNGFQCTDGEKLKRFQHFEPF